MAQSGLPREIPSASDSTWPLSEDFESSALPRVHAHAGEQVAQVWGVIPVQLPRREH